MNGHAPNSATVGVPACFTMVAFICAVLRIYNRIVLKKALGVDDVFIGVAAILSSLLSIDYRMQVKFGLGRHESSLTEDDKIMLFLWFYISVFFYCLGLFFTKFSILLMYLRIFPQKAFRRTVFALMAFIAIYTAWAMASNIFACTPIRRFWDPTAGGAHGWCYDRATIWYLSAGFTILTDVIIVFLPFPVIKNLNVRGTRIGLLMAVVLYLGGVTCVVAIARLEAIYAITERNDVSWDNPLAAIWSSVELNSGIICACLPSLKDCAVRLFPGLSPSAHDKATELSPTATIGGTNPPGMQGRKARAQSTTLLQTQQWEEEVMSPVERSNTVECAWVQSSAGEQSPGAPSPRGISVLTSVKLDTSTCIDEKSDWRSSRTSSEPV